MKTIHFILLLVLSCLMLSQATNAQDTITVELSSKAKIVIYAKDRDALVRLRSLDLNKIIREVTAGLDTTTQTNGDQVKTYEYELDFDSEETIMISETSSIRTNSTIKRTYKRPRFRQFWGIDLGLNNYLENGSFPDASGQPYGLRIDGSRFVSFGTYQRMRLGGQKSIFSLQMGLEWSWHNFMFEGNNYLVREDDALVYRDYLEDFGQTLRKTKLTVSYLNLPLTLNARFRDRDGRRTFNLGVGGYIGTRLTSYTKTRENNSNSSDRTRDNFFLNNWRYGVEAHFGFRDVLLFAKYDLNTLFVPDRGPELNAFAFGIRL